MASIDKAAIGWTIAIVAFGVGIAVMGGSLGGDTALYAPTMSSERDTMSEQKSTTNSMEEQKRMLEEQIRMLEEQQMEERNMMGDSMMGDKMMTGPMMSGPQIKTVSIPSGTSVPGCENTNECYLPPDMRVSVGDTVEWNNDDTAAHTVTSGTLRSGPTNVFDSSLLASGNSFSYTFDSRGTYDYYCIVHPWMIGTVQVQ